MNTRKFKGTPPRLERLYSDSPIYFVTFKTLNRRNILAHEAIDSALTEYAETGVPMGAAVGIYVIMPDHVHLFVRLSPDRKLGRWEKGLKDKLGKQLAKLGYSPQNMPNCKLKSFWQPGFFDHILRSSESYRQKAQYVLDNPVRAGLVKKPEEWPFRGEIVALDPFHS